MKELKYSYLEPINLNEEYFCIYCRNPLIDPVILPCREMICKDCIPNKVLNGEEKENCFLCGIEYSKDSLSYIIPNFIIGTLNSLKVLCTRCGSGEQINRVDFEDHLENSCRTECELKCGEMLTKSEIQLHNDICRKYPVECSAKDVGCQWSGIREEKEEHEKKCSILPLKPVLLSQKNQNEQLKNEVDRLSEIVDESNKKIENLNETKDLLLANFLYHFFGEDIEKLETLEYPDKEKDKDENEKSQVKELC